MANPLCGGRGARGDKVVCGAQIAGHTSPQETFATGVARRCRPAAAPTLARLAAVRGVTHSEGDRLRTDRRGRRGRRSAPARWATSSRAGLLLQVSRASCRSRRARAGRRFSPGAIHTGAAPMPPRRRRRARRQGPGGNVLHPKCSPRCSRTPDLRRHRSSRRATSHRSPRTIPGTVRMTLPCTMLLRMSHA